MRIDLTTTFHEHKAAKALGARWDFARRVWYVIDPDDLTPFLKWIPSGGAASARVVPAYKKAQPSRKKQRHKFGVTKSAPVPHCGCNVLPWDDCEHTYPTD